MGSPDPADEISIDWSGPLTESWEPEQVDSAAPSGHDGARPGPEEEQR